jgi:membrane-bound ClpP family serine protease
MVVTTSAIGALLILVGIVVFVVDLHLIGHGLLTVGGIATLLAGGCYCCGRASLTRACCSAS